MSKTHEHFLAAAEVWQAYFDGQISMQKRDRLLEVFRAQLLREVPLPK